MKPIQLVQVNYCCYDSVTRNKYESVCHTWCWWSN